MNHVELRRRSRTGARSYLAAGASVLGPAASEADGRHLWRSRASMPDPERRVVQCMACDGATANFVSGSSSHDGVEQRERLTLIVQGLEADRSLRYA